MDRDDAQAVSFGQLLWDGDDCLQIPFFQRSYAWEKKQVNAFWEDILSAYRRSDDSTYFMGVIVRTAVPGASIHGESVWDIIEGQQRITTAMILLSVIRDAFVSLNATTDADGIENEWMSPWISSAQDRVPRLRLGASEDDFFFTQQVLKRRDGTIPIGMKPSEKRIHEAREILQARLAELMAEESDPLVAVGKMKEFLAKRVIVSRVTSSDQASGFRLFEALNTRGLPLSTADRLKARLLGTAAGQTSVPAAWARVNAIIQPTEFDQFLRHHWAASYGAPPVLADLPDQFELKIRTPDEAALFARAMSRDADHYSILAAPSASSWLRDIHPELEFLSKIGVAVSRPILLAAMRSSRFARGENLLPALHMLARRIVSWGVREKIAGKVGNGPSQRANFAVAQAILSGSLPTNNEEMFERFLDIIQDNDTVPDDAAFRALFANARVNARDARAYLTQLENADLPYRRRATVPAPVVNNLEHVLPRSKRTWLTDWPEFGGEHKQFVWRLGNLAVMLAEDNSVGENRPFPAKRPLYEAAGLKLTRNVAEVAAKSGDRWTPGVVAERQEHLADLALRCWPLRPWLDR